MYDNSGSGSIVHMDVIRAAQTELAPGFPPVLVLEGARTCGKTYLARKLVENGVWSDLQSLADPATLELARHDSYGWLASLPAATVIDEAQLLDDLPLHVKRLVDEDQSRRFLLTGSARIGRTGLGGSDPLVGRVRRWRLWPLTNAELTGQPQSMASLVDRLFDRSIINGGPYPPFDLPGRVNKGGFPLLALVEQSTAACDQWVRDTILGLLTDSVLPDERFDAGIALRLLAACLRGPGAILNLASLGDRLGIDPRTVDRYLDVLERRFLLHFLPNLATNPMRQTRARSKIHPVDTAFTANALRDADPATMNSPTTLGGLFESYVVNQIVPCLQFAQRRVAAFFWRDAKTSAEVDCVLVDGAGNRVGVEVKSSTSVRLSDASGLQALAADGPMAAGYVIYPGTKVVRLTEGIHALPVAALGDC